jgi:hypothetical protein
MLAAMVLCTASLAMADDVLYCADTEDTGFSWDDTGKGVATKFNPHRFTVKVISDTERVISDMNEYHPPDTYTCRSTVFGNGQIACDSGLIRGFDPWVFYKNNYTHAFLGGPLVGPPNKMEQNIMIAYGTCTHF